jgi:hypothetical protein
MNDAAAKPPTTCARTLWLNVLRIICSLIFILLVAAALAGCQGVGLTISKPTEYGTATLSTRDGKAFIEFSSK